MSEMVTALGPPCRPSSPDRPLSETSDMTLLRKASA
jgi:hypothetical protein